MGVDCGFPIRPGFGKEAQAASLFVEYAFFKGEESLKGLGQIFVTTHQPYFVDALRPEETWVLEKEPDGFAAVRRASDDEVVKAMVHEGLPLGGLWYSDYLDRR